MEWKIQNKDIIEWATSYDGPLFHAIVCDPPYNLDTIKKRFGSKDSAPAKYGTDGVFQRSSKGFMGQEWDTDIAFQQETWEAIMGTLHPGALCMSFSSTRTYHRMATAIDNAGFIIHPMIGWIQAQGFPKATNTGKMLKRRGDERAGIWNEHRYGLQALKPSLEPICVFQKPFDSAPLDNIVESGAGTIWVDGNRVGEDTIPSNQFDDGMKPFGHGAGHPFTQVTNKGRWPANVVLSGDVGLPYEKFFYCAKPSKKERNAGAENTHPTVKPIKLTKHLTKLLLPPEEYNPRRLLVPFCGSGSEMIGGLLAGWDEITGVEIEATICEIADKRLGHWANEKI